jgi:hypothetical protein
VITNPRPLTAAEVLLLCVGAVVVVALVLRARRPNISLATLVAASLCASVIVSAPFTAWSLVKDIRVSRDYSTFQADRIGPEGNGLDTTVVDRVAERIPTSGTYAFVIAPKGAETIGTVFRIWAEAVLLPRHEVAKPSKGQWVVSFGASPAMLGVSARAVRIIRSGRSPRLDAWVGIAS